MHRRSFLAGSAALLAAPSYAFDPDFMVGERRVVLYRPETREQLDLVYLRNGSWVPDAYPRICWFLRDWQAGVAIEMDLRLIATLDWIGAFLRSHGIFTPIHILSAYRTEATNQKLKKSAKKSEHLTGKAVDLRIPGVSAAYLQKLFIWLEQGGVGMYPHDHANQEFLHLDTGRIRQW